MLWSFWGLSGRTSSIFSKDGLKIFILGGPFFGCSISSSLRLVFSLVQVLFFDFEGW